MSSIPIDILQDLFLFLKRNEVEKCQLICQKWNATSKSSSSILPLRFIKELKIVVRSSHDPYAMADGQPIFETFRDFELEKVQKRAEYLRFCVIEELKFESNGGPSGSNGILGPILSSGDLVSCGLRLDNKRIQEMFKFFKALCNMKLQALKVDYESDQFLDTNLSEMAKFLAEFIEARKFFLSIAHRRNFFQNASDIRKVYEDLEAVSEGPRKMKIYVSFKLYLLNQPMISFLFEKCDPKSKLYLIFGQGNHAYTKQSCIDVIRYYLDHKNPEILVKSILFENFQKNVPVNQVLDMVAGQQLFLDWIKEISSSSVIQNVEKSGKCYKKEIFEIKEKNEIKLKIIFTSEICKNAILSMKIKLLS